MCNKFCGVLADFERSYQILQRIHSKLLSSSLGNAHDNILNILCLLGSPLLGRLVDVDVSLTQLASLAHLMPQLASNDFDLDPSSGYLIPDPKLLQSRNVEEIDKYTFEREIEKAAQNRLTEVIELYKADKGSLGFGVVGLRSELRGELGIFVQEIQPGGIAAKYVPGFSLSAT